MAVEAKQAQRLLIIFSGLIVLALVGTHIIVQLLLWIATLVVMYKHRVLATNTRKLGIIHLFIFLGVLPLMVGLVAADDVGLVYLWSSWGISTRTLTLALSVFLRASVTSLLVTLLLHYIPFYTLCQSLRSWGVPKLLIELVELSYRYIYLLLEQGEHIYEAQLMRLGYRGYSARYRHTSQLFARSFILAHNESQKMYEGLLTRLFDAMSSPNSCQNEDVPLLVLRDIRYSYKGGRSETLKGLSTSLSRGERIVLLGANGAGKSTLMRLLAGLISDYSGDLIWQGSKIGLSQKDLGIQRKHIALVMQNANHQLFCPSVEDEIAFGLRNSGLSEDEVRHRVEAIIECYELQDLRTTAPHLLSEGQKKWVSIAAVMALCPDVVLLDEPTACLDYYYTQKVLELLSRYADTGCSIIISTHDMNLAYTWANRAWVLTEGGLAYDDSIKTLFTGDYDLERMKIARPYSINHQESQRIPLRATDNHPYTLGLFHKAGTTQGIIFGWGAGARRKALTLWGAGISTTIVAPEVDLEEVAQSQYATDPLATFIPGTYSEYKSLIPKHNLVIAATGIPTIDTDICLEAARYGCMYSSLSDPQLGNIQFGAQLNKAGIHIAVHSAYRLPEVMQGFRDIIAGHIEEEYRADFELLAKLRQEGRGEEYTRLRDELLNRLRSSR